MSDGSLGDRKDVANDIAASVIAMRFVVGRIERCLVCAIASDLRRERTAIRLNLVSSAAFVVSPLSLRTSMYADL